MSDLALPEGWVKTNISNVADVGSGIGFPKIFQGESKGEYPVYKVSDISNAYLNNNGYISTAANYVDEDVAKELKGKIFREGSTIFAKIGEAIKLNRRVIVRVEGLVDNNVMAVVPVISSMDDYIYYYLKTIDLRSVCRSSAIPSLRQGDILSLEFNLPSKLEQKEIVSLLDTHLTTVSQIQARLDAIPKLIEKFRQSVLNDAVSGKLTEEWREKNETKSINLNEITEFWTEKYSLDGKKYKLPLFEPLVVKSDLPNNWHYTQLGKIFDVYVGSTPSRKENQYWNGDIPWVSSSEVAFCRIKNTKEKVTEIGIKNTSTNVHPVGTVMLAMIGQGKTRGQAAILDIEACHNQNTAAIRIPKPFVISDYLYFYLMKMYQETRMVGSGNNQKALNKSRVQSLGLRLPPIDEQEQIVKQINQLFAHADQIEKSVDTAKARVDHLTQSILHQAFTGNLTAEWREQNFELINGENSAEALLAKIKAEKQGSGKKGKVKK